MRVSVAICTWNRARLLEQTLTGFCKLRVPDGVDWELIVVNNNCTDDTEQVATSFSDRLPIRHVVERKQGQSHARNCAHDLATGDLICWTDDDVLVDANWVAAYIDTSERWPRAGFFGGRIVPWFEHDPPAWLRKNQQLLAGMLVARDLGSNEQVFPPGEWPFGANMAFRREAVAGLRFDPNLGLVGDNAIRRDETNYCRRLVEAGIDGVWVPSASVQHWVGASRMTLAYVRTYFQGYGRGKVRESGPSKGHVVFGAPRWLYRAYAAAAVRSTWQRLWGHDEWIRNYTTAAELRGIILENRDQRRGNA